MSVKMIDIARKAGVTRQAVSAVLNHPDTCRISSAMQEKIRQIASEMGYSPNIAARILKGANSSTIGVIDSNLQFGVTATRFREIILQLRDRRLNAILKVVQAPDVVPESSIKEFENSIQSAVTQLQYDLSETGGGYTELEIRVDNSDSA